MSRPARLPDFIEVANIKDLFWNNNSDLYPTCIPTGYAPIEKTRPTFLSPYVGTCVLRGEWNHCLFNGKYYFLTKLEVLDIEKNEYRYQLDYDVMINCLNTGADVRGTIIKTNRKDILDGCLQTTVPILADPIRKYSYTKGKTKKTWQEELVIRGLTNKDEVNDITSRFREKTITREGYQAFVYWVENNIIGKGTKDKEWLADRVIGGWNHYAHQNPLFILARLPQETVENRWKTNVVRHIANFLQTTKREDLVITKQTTPTDHFNIGGYVVGKKDETLGSNVVTEVKLTKLDLEGLTDIVPVDYKTKELINPDKDISYDFLPHTRNPEVPKPTSIYTLLRKPYLPIGNARSTTGCISNQNSDSLLDYCQTGLLEGSNTPQVIETVDSTNFYLWYLNKNNLPLIEEYDPELLKNSKSKLSVSTWDSANTWWGFFHTEYKNIAPIGFLIYQIRKLYGEWEDLEYKGSGVNALFIRTGLNISKIDGIYVKTAQKHWWSQADENLLGLWGNDYRLSRLILDLDQFNWLTITPPEKGRTYKWNTQDYWGYKKFFKELGNSVGYPSLANRSNIKWAGGEVINPYSYQDPDTALPKWLGERDRKLNEVSLYKQVELGCDIKNGDIVTTSLEHGWFNLGAFTQWILPFNISLAEFNEWISKDLSTTIDVKDQEFLDTSDDTVTKNALIGTAVASSVLAAILAPFTGGLSVGLAALGATAGITALGKKIVVDGDNKQQMGSIINVFPYSNSELQADEVVNNEIEDGTIVLYLYGGTYRVGIYKKKTLKLDLEKNNNLIKKVDGSTHRELDLMMIRPIGEVNYKNTPSFPEDLKNQVIKYATGNKDTLIPLDKTHYYSENDLKTLPLTFDLVGTNWYLVLNNGKVNFVPKTNEDFRPIEDEGGEIEIKNEVSTYAKINQKAWLNFYGQTFPLTTKFNFNESFKYSIMPIQVENEYADPDVEYKWLTVDEDNDNIDVLVTIPRKQMRSAEKVDAAQVLMMKERLLQLTTNYEQDKYANELLIGDKRLAMARQREDLDWMKTQAGINIGTKAVGGVLGLYGAKKGGATALPLAAGAFAAAASLGSDISTLIRHPTLMKRVDEDERNLLLANTQQLYQRKLNYEHDFKFQTLKLNKVAGSYQKPGVSNRDAQEKYNKKKSLDNVYIEVLLPSVAQQKRINHIYDIFGCECVSDYFEQTPLSIRNGMPGGLYRFSKIEKGGINTLITDTTIRDILKQILENGVKFIDCEIELEPVETIPLRRTLPRPTQLAFNTENIKDWAIDKWDTYRINTPKKDVIQTIKGIPNYGLTDQEWTANRDRFTDVDDDTLLDLLNRVMANRERGESIVIAPPVDVDVEKERLNQTIHTLRSTISNLQEQIKTNTEVCTANTQQLEEEKRALETQLTLCQQQHTTLTRDKEGKEGEITTLKAEIKKLTDDKAALTTQLTKAREDLAKATSDKETTAVSNTNEINRLKGEITRLKAQVQTTRNGIRRINSQLTDRQNQLNQRVTELNQCKNDLAGKVNEINNLKDRLAKQTQAVTDAAARFVDVNRLQAELAKKTKDYEDLQKQFAAKVRDLSNLQTFCESEKTAAEKLKKDLESEIRQHKVDKEDLTQQLNNERVRAINEKDEINRLKKEVEGLKNTPKDTKYHCELLKSLFGLNFKSQTRQVNEDIVWSPYKDLLGALAITFNWMRRGRADTYMLNLARKNNKPATLKFTEYLEQIQNNHDLDTMMTIVGSQFYYALWGLIKKNEQPKNREVLKEDIEALKTITESEKYGGGMIFKDWLDELYWQSYKAWQELKSDVNLIEDSTVKYIFDHVIFGGNMEAYKVVYGDPAIGLIKRYFVEGDCKSQLGTKTVLGRIDEIRTEIDEYLSRKPAELAPGRIGTPPNMPLYIPVSDGGTNKYPLNTHGDIFRPNINKFINKKNNNQTYRGAKQTKYGERLGGYIALQDGYKYFRYSTKDRSRSRACVWLYTGFIRDVGRREEPILPQHKKYMYIDTFNNKANKHTQVVDGIRSLIHNMDKMTVSRAITPETLDYIQVNYQHIDLTDTQLARQQLTINKETLKSFGDKFKDLIKLFYIFDRNKVEWVNMEKDTTDSYWLYDLNFSRNTNISSYAFLGGSSTLKTDTNNKKYLEFNLGAHISTEWIYEPKHVNDIYLYAMSYILSNNLETNLYNPVVYPYVLLSYFYSIIADPQSYIHPWQWDSGAVYMFFDEMYKLANT